MIKDTKQSIPHLLFQFCPSIHPKILLKRKDITSGIHFLSKLVFLDSILFFADIMNALDYHGNTPLLKCAIQDSRDSVRRLLSSKAAIERHLLDLSVQNMYGRNVLHYLVLNRDRHNIKLFLNILEDSKDALNAVDSYNMSPLMYCLDRNYIEEAEIIINHPKAQEKLKLENADSQGKTLLHLAAERGNFKFWTVLTSLQSCNLCMRDDDGNTPLMAAAKAKQNGMIRSWIGKQNNKPTNIM